MINNKKITIYLSDDEKLIIESASKLANPSISSYIRGIVLNQTRIDLTQDDTIILNNQDRDDLMRVLSKPIKPNVELRKLIN